MASVIFKAFGQINETSKVKLFTSHKEGYGDGGQLRDFIYVKDICKVIRFMMEHEHINGLFNLGTGKARSFAALAKATFAAMGKPENIEYNGSIGRLWKCIYISACLWRFFWWNRDSTSVIWIRGIITYHR